MRNTGDSMSFIDNQEQSRDDTGRPQKVKVIFGRWFMSWDVNEESAYPEGRGWQGSTRVARWQSSAVTVSETDC